MKDKQTPARKPYRAPKLIEYGDLGTLIRTNPGGIGMPDGGGGTGMMKGQFKTG